MLDHNLPNELNQRGLVKDVSSPDIGQWINAGSRTLYAGFDPTSASLHVGHLLPIMMLRRFQRAGHRPIALVGGATGMIGDPSGKSEERNLLSVDRLNENVAAIKKQLQAFLDFDGPGGALLVNNYDWMSKFSYLDFLRDVGKHFPVNVMLAKDSVSGRLESEAGISYTEFSYMLLQAYDFVHLNRHHGCGLQIGGSDQWGNITAGIDLARRMHRVQLHGMTCPLLLKSDGTKMGKTERGALFLDPAWTSPYAFYQYWVNVADSESESCLNFLTELTHDELRQLALARQTHPEKRESQKQLAEELTRLVHGEAGLAAARKATDVFFGAEIENLTDKELGDIFADVPSVTLPRDRLAGEGLPLADALVETSLAKSKSEARRTIAQGGAYVNNLPRSDVNAKLTTADLASETVMVLRSGKKKYALLRVG